VLSIKIVDGRACWRHLRRSTRRGLLHVGIPLLRFVADLLHDLFLYLCSSWQDFLTARRVVSLNYQRLFVCSTQISMQSDAPHYLGLLTRVDDLPGRRTLRVLPMPAASWEVMAKFHFTGLTGPARTFSRDPGRRPGSPTKSADFVWSGPVGPV